MERQQGSVVSWKGKQGYGFIRPDTHKEDIFLHITDIRGKMAPHMGERVEFEVIQSEGKWRASRVSILGRSSFERVKPWGFLFLGANALLIAIFYYFELWRLYPLISVYVGMSFLAFITYGLDKLYAKGQWRRVAELSLHTIDLFGGWPGAWVAQYSFRHKTNKQSFQIVFYGIVVLHVCFWIWLWTR